MSWNTTPPSDIVQGGDSRRTWLERSDPSSAAHGRYRGISRNVLHFFVAGPVLGLPHGGSKVGLQGELVPTISDLVGRSERERPVSPRPGVFQDEPMVHFAGPLEGLQLFIEMKRLSRCRVGIGVVNISEIERHAGIRCRATRIGTCAESCAQVTSHGDFRRRIKEGTV